MGIAALVYNASAAAAGATNTDFVAATDADFSQRNSHYIFSEQYQLLAAAAVGVSVTRGRFQVPTWNAIGEACIFNANRALQPPSNAQYDLYASFPPQIPLMEELQVQMSNNLGAATEIENVLLLLGTMDWNRNLPRPSTGMKGPGGPIVIRATAAITPTLNAWSGPNAITLSQSLRGGVYAVVGATVQGTNAMAFRIVFPRYRLYNGRKLRPGWLTQTAVGDVISNQIDPWVMSLGEWGRFHTFELPSIEVFGTLAGAITYQIFLWVVYLGEDPSLLNQGLGGGY